MFGLQLAVALPGFCTQVMDPQATVELVQQQLQAGKDEKPITKKLINEAVIERRCKDNCTVMLVRFERCGGASL
jgi:integrin-linked kinase-associated serine/threonine phosphatase 2C